MHLWRGDERKAAVVSFVRAEKELKITMKLFILVFVLALTGCVAVPTSEIQFGAGRARLPKDSSADELTLTVQSGTNFLTFHAKGWTTRNNPDTIKASTDQIRAHYAGAGDLAAKVVAASKPVPSP
jgi:hypothetical protein